jgi:hypothetical protein
MKAITIILFLMVATFGFTQDTLTHIEWIEGQKVLIKEITQHDFIQHDLPRIITMILTVISVLVFIFYPKSKTDESTKKTPKN